MTETILLEIEHERYVLRVTGKTFRGNYYANIRVWAPDPTGELLPTKQGVMLRMDDMGKVIKALETARQRGLSFAEQRKRNLVVVDGRTEGEPSSLE